MTDHTTPALPPAPSTDAPPARMLPLLPLRNTVLFPHLFVPLSVGRPNSVSAVEATLASEEKTFLVSAQKDGASDAPSFTDLHTVGTRAVIKKMARNDNVIELIVQGVERVRLVEVVQTEPYLQVRYEPYPLPEDGGTEVEATVRAIVDLAVKVLELAEVQAPISVPQLVAQAQDPLRFAFLLGSMLSLDVEREQRLLEATTRHEALSLLHEYLSHEVQVLQVRRQISSKVETEMSKQQREFMLRQQMQAIQQELGEKNPEKAEVDELRRRLAEADLPDEVRKEADRELNRLERLPPAAPDHQVIRSYLELMLELPWKKATVDVIDLHHTRAVLDEDHYGLEPVKERILEDLAVLKLNPQARAPILLLVGPPGVGKTSLGQSIARAMGRKFERFSLGGLHDEAELRGHRRTYIGAMPGRVIQALRRAGVSNPVLMLDEVDKLGRDHRGDPASALLEILDPAQNGTFRDNYLDLPFDLSKVFFIMTANTLDTIPRPLLDRMEILRLSGYSEEEKLQIAQRYLVPRQLKHAGLTAEQLQLPPETVRHVIGRYTREAGVRELERTLGRIARKVARQFAEGRTEPVRIDLATLPDLLGQERNRPEKSRRDLPAGVSTGLAWTETGGDVLYVEAAHSGERRELRLTGQLGKVMKESAKAARSMSGRTPRRWASTRGRSAPTAFTSTSPPGRCRRTGRRPGWRLVTALTSLYTGVPVSPDVAMTGEITLSGLVLPVGGIKERCWRPAAPVSSGWYCRATTRATSATCQTTSARRCRSSWSSGSTRRCAPPYRQSATGSNRSPPGEIPFDAVARRAYGRDCPPATGARSHPRNASCPTTIPLGRAGAAAAWPHLAAAAAAHPAGRRRPGGRRAAGDAPSARRTMATTPTPRPQRSRRAAT
ncbi:MAG: endopeptidase La [Gemmataceae bacterium]